MLVTDMLKPQDENPESTDKPKTTMYNINHLNKQWGEVPKFHEKLCHQAKWLNKKVKAAPQQAKTKCRQSLEESKIKTDK